MKSTVVHVWGGRSQESGTKVTQYHEIFCPGYRKTKDSKKAGGTFLLTSSSHCPTLAPQLVTPSLTCEGPWCRIGEPKLPLL